jgi:hypothetical protein
MGKVSIHEAELSYSSQINCPENRDRFTSIDIYSQQQCMGGSKSLIY